MIADEKVRVRFSTKLKEYRITDTPFSIPSTLGRTGLSEVVNHLLDLDVAKPFDFSINNILVRSPLQKFLAVHQISTETIIVIEYFPATSLSEDNQSKEVPAWIGSIDVTADGAILAGCYDGNVKIFSSSNLEETGTILAHDDPIRAVCNWNIPSSSDKKFMATASKDQTVKCWDISDTSNAVHVATLSGHVNSVEALSVWKSNSGIAGGKDFVLISGDWTGTLFGWNVNSLNDGSSATSNDTDAQQKKKRKKAADFMSAASSSVVNTSMKPMFAIKAHAQAVSGISCSQAAGKHNSLFTCSWDHAIKEWDLERQDCITTFAGSRVVTSLDCSSDESNSMLLATSHPDGKVRCWDPRHAQEAGVAKITLGKTVQWISQVKWQPNSAILLSAADYAGNVSLWDVRASNVPLGCNEVHDGKALCVNWINAVDKEQESVFKIVSGGSDCCLKSTEIQH